MIEAYKNGDEESYNLLFKYREVMFTNLLVKEADLVYYGRFSVRDIEKMRYVEWMFHWKTLKERIDEENKRNEELLSRARGIK